MKKWVFATGGVLTVGASAALVTSSLVAQPFDDAMRPQPGQYEAEITLISLDMPDLPPDMTDIMRGVFEQKFEFCMTEEEIEEGYRSMLNRGRDGDCTYDSFSAANGRISGQMTCEGGGGAGPITMVMDGTGTPTSSDVTMTMTGDMGTGPGQITMRVVNNRVGDCS